MEGGNLTSRSTIQGSGSYGGFDLQGPMRVLHHHQQQQQQQLAPHHQHSSRLRQGSSIVHHDNFPLTMGTAATQEDQTFSLGEYRKSTSDEDEPSLTEDAADIRNEQSKGKKASSPWQRVKWTDEMVRMLITAVSYISEEAAAEYGGSARRKYSNLQKKGKWKSVSKVMAERGHFVSPQQCEDKFNDLNKRYKRLNEILGRGTSCEVVENPVLLDVMDHIPEKAKEEVRKILSSKHLYYEEMCSYHNGNRLHLPPDPELQRSLRLALRCRDDHDEADLKRHVSEDNEEVDDQEAEFDDYEENCGVQGNSSKRLKQCETRDDFSFRNSLDCNKAFNFQAENVISEGTKVNAALQKQSTNHWNLQFEEQRLNLDMQMLELEKEKFKWQRFCRKKDHELEMMKMEIEKMKLENERMALDLRRKELGTDEN